MERLRKAKPVLLAIAAVCGLLVTVGGGAETPSAARQATIAASPAHAHQSGKSSGPAQSSLDFETYRTRIEPIFLKQRQGGVRCYDCHSVLATRLRLEPLSPGNSAWTTEQSRRNFEVISQLITPSDPLKSRLLLHPLAQEAIREASSGLRRVIRSGKYLPIGSATAPRRDRPPTQHLVPTQPTPLISNFLELRSSQFS